MSRCLSDRKLMRVLAELATPAERTHLATCASCSARHRRLTGEMETITRVLVTTPEPAPRRVTSARRWVPAVAALSAVAVAGLLWLEVIVWRALRPEPGQVQQYAAVLADVSSALFSVSGVPDRESFVPELRDDDDAEIECDEAARLVATRCGDALSDLEEGIDLINAGNPDGDGVN